MSQYHDRYGGFLDAVPHENCSECISKQTTILRSDMCEHLQTISAISVCVTHFIMNEIKFYTGKKLCYLYVGLRLLS